MPQILDSWAARSLLEASCRYLQKHPEMEVHTDQDSDELTAVRPPPTLLPTPFVCWHEVVYVPVKRVTIVVSRASGGLDATGTPIGRRGHNMILGWLTMYYISGVSKPFAAGLEHAFATAGFRRGAAQRAGRARAQCGAAAI